MSNALQLVSKKSGKITIHAEIIGAPCQAWAEYGFRAHGIDTSGKEVRNVIGQKNVKGFAADYKSITVTPGECDKQRLMEICSRPYYSDFDYFWDTQGSQLVSKDEIKDEWMKHHSCPLNVPISS